jgi:hypothetical protein
MTTTMNNAQHEPVPPPSAQAIAELGEAIYKQKYQHDFEKNLKEKFVAINVNTGEATIADTTEEAVRIALGKDPDGFFHLVQVGHQSAFDAGWLMSYGR